MPPASRNVAKVYNQISCPSLRSISLLNLFAWGRPQSGEESLRQAVCDLLVFIPLLDLREYASLQLGSPACSQTSKAFKLLLFNVYRTTCALVSSNSTRPHCLPTVSSSPGPQCFMPPSQTPFPSPAAEVINHGFPVLPHYSPPSRPWYIPFLFSHGLPGLPQPRPLP